MVTGALGLRWYDVVVTGQDAHAGPTPMRLQEGCDGRRGEDGHGGQCARISLPARRPRHGRLHAGQAELAQRHPRRGALFGGSAPRQGRRSSNKMEAEMRAKCAQLAQAAERVRSSIERVANYPACQFDASCVSAVRNAAQKLGLSHMDIVSGAGHDAIYMARIAPTSMIFVPCEGGISHNEIENAKPEDLAAGCNVLLQRHARARRRRGQRVRAAA